MADIFLNLVVIRSVNIEHSVQFYKLLGLNFIKHQHGNGPEHYASELGMLVFEIYPHIDPVTPTRIGFQVNSLDSLFGKLQESNVHVISPPKDSPWGRRAVVVDPDGHRVELVENTTGL